MPQPDSIPQGPATGFEQWIKKGQEFPDLRELLKSAPAQRDPELEEELKKDHKTQQSQ